MPHYTISYSFHHMLLISLYVTHFPVCHSFPISGFRVYKGLGFRVYKGLGFRV